jgi:hypothetical protein
MRKTILYFATVALSLSATGQTVRVDSASNMSYVRVVPQSVPLWMQYENNAPTITRLYVSLVNDNLANTAIFNFTVNGEVVIDSETKMHPPLKSGRFSITDTAYTNWNANDNTVPFKKIIPILGLQFVD